MKKYFKLVIEKDKSANMYVGEVPGLSGCHTHGKTIDKLMKNMQEVIELCLDTKKEKARNLPNIRMHTANRNLNITPISQKT